MGRGGLGGVNWFGGSLPLGFFGVYVYVYVEPGRRRTVSELAVTTVEGGGR